MVFSTLKYIDKSPFSSNWQKGRDNYLGYLQVRPQTKPLYMRVFHLLSGKQGDGIFLGSESVHRFC